jgi:hypothetical protein
VLNIEANDATLIIIVCHQALGESQSQDSSEVSWLPPWKSAIGKGVVDGLSVFKSNNAKGLSVEFFYVTPESNAAVGLNLSSFGICHYREAPLRKDIGAFA